MPLFQEYSYLDSYLQKQNKKSPLNGEFEVS